MKLDTKIIKEVARHVPTDEQSLGDDRDRAAQAHRLLFPIVEFQASQRARPDRVRNPSSASSESAERV